MTPVQPLDAPAATPADAAPLSAPPYLLPTTALYLDFDGTLADLALRPESVRVAPGLPALLTRLYARHGGAVAIVTGRRLMHVDTLLTPVRLPGAGVHGAELRLTADAVAAVREVPAIARLARELRERYVHDERLLIEDKGAAVALHYRLAPERAAECEATLRALAAEQALGVLSGHQVVEAHLHGIDKGAALRELAGHEPFSGRTPVFVGDDRADEFAFAAAEAMGGYGVKVGPGASIARYRLQSVADVHAWLCAGV